MAVCIQSDIAADIEGVADDQALAVGVITTIYSQIEGAAEHRHRARAETAHIDGASDTGRHIRCGGTHGGRTAQNKRAAGPIVQRGGVGEEQRVASRGAHQGASPGNPAGQGDVGPRAKEDVAHGTEVGRVVHLEGSGGDAQLLALLAGFRRGAGPGDATKGHVVDGINAVGAHR